MDIERYPYPPQVPERSRRGVPTVVWAAIIALLVVVCAVFFLLWQITVHRYNKMVDIGKISLKVLSSPDTWFGVTYAADKPKVVAALRELTESGKYPDGLWDNKTTD